METDKSLFSRYEQAVEAIKESSIEDKANAIVSVDRRLIVDKEFGYFKSI